jgi:aryl carrier-like protein
MSQVHDNTSKLSPSTRSNSGDGFILPRSRLEEQLARIWSEVLKRDAVSMDDNFFELGGDSILVTQIVSRAARAGLRLSSSDFQIPNDPPTIRRACDAWRNVVVRDRLTKG